MEQAKSYIASGSRRQLTMRFPEFSSCSESQKMNEIDFTIRVFPAVGRCIYCDSTDSLSDEHIVPYFLRGKMTLPASSCETCRKVTHRFETAVAEATKMVRAQWKMPSRKRSWRGLFAKGLTNPLGIEGAEPAGVFSNCMLPILPLPREVSRIPNLPGNLPISGLSIGTITSHPAEQSPGALTFPLRMFERMLAKIAFSFTVAQVGLDKAPLDLRPFILRENTDIADVVGGCPYEVAPPPRPLVVSEDGNLTYEPFILGHGCLSAGVEPRLMVHIQLMRWLGAPVYWVVIGVATDELALHLGLPLAN